MKKLVLPLLCLTLLLGCAPAPVPQTTAPTAGPTVPTPVPPTTGPAASGGIPVETPCGTLRLPDNWDSPITVDTTLGDPMTITFLAEEVPLYDLTFSSYAGPDAIGTVTVNSETLYVGLQQYALSEETDLLLDMQESVNLLLSQLPLEPLPEASGRAGAREDLLLLTPWGGLHFPRVWEDCLVTDQPDKTTLAFYCRLPDHEPVLLFTISFGSTEGPITATLTDARGNATDLSLSVSEPLFDGSWEPGEMDAVYAMQEDMNYLLGFLS